MLGEPELIGGNLRIRNKGSVVGDNGFELSSKRVTLDPVHHETSITGTRSHAIFRVNEVKLVSDILPGLDQIVVGVAT